MTTGIIPGYVTLCKNREIDDRIRRACNLLSQCTVCPRQCRVNRIAGEHGFCQTGVRAMVSSYGQHFGEEPPLVGTSGSGTIFMTHCNLACDLCQNYEISQCGAGEEVSCEVLAGSLSGCSSRDAITST